MLKNWNHGFIRQPSEKFNPTIGIYWRSPHTNIPMGQSQCYQYGCFCVRMSDYDVHSTFELYRGSCSPRQRLFSPMAFSAKSSSGATDSPSIPAGSPCTSHDRKFCVASSLIPTREVRLLTSYTLEPQLSTACYRNLPRHGDKLA